MDKMILYLVPVVIAMGLFSHPATAEIVMSIGNFKWNSDTAFNGILDHANTAERTYTFPDLTGTITLTSGAQTLSSKSIDADTNTLTNIENADIKAGANVDAAKVGTGVVSTTEYNYLDGVTSAIQTQINGIVIPVINDTSPASYIMEQVGGSTTWRIINGSTGNVDYSSTDEESILQSAINSLVHGGTIYIKTPRDNLVLTSGLTITNQGIRIIGDSVLGEFTNTEEGVIFSSSTNNINFTEVDAESVTINNIRFDADGTGQNGVVIQDGRQSRFDGLVIHGPFNAGILINPQTALASNMVFGKIQIKGAVDGLVFSAPGFGVCGTSNSFADTVITGYSSHGIWFKGCNDGNYFGRVQITSPSTNPVSAITIGSSATCNWCYSNTITQLAISLDNAADTAIEITAQDLQYTDDHSLLIGAMITEGAGNCVTLAANTAAPLIITEAQSSICKRSTHFNSIFLEGLSTFTNTMTSGSLGSMKIPVKASAGAPSDAQGGNVDGTIVANTNEGTIYLRSGGSWVDVDGSGSSVFTGSGKTHSWPSLSMNGIAMFNGTNVINSTRGLTWDPGNAILRVQKWAAQPVISIFRNETNMVSGTTIGSLNFQGPDSSGAPQIYSLVIGKVKDSTAGSEDGDLTLSTFVAGAQTAFIQLVSDTGLIEVFKNIDTNNNNVITAGAAIRNPAYSFTTTLSGGAVTANRTLNLPLTTQTETLAIRPVTSSATNATVQTTTSATHVFAGRALTITPVVTGNIKVSYTGYSSSNTLLDGCTLSMREGTGAFPRAGAAVSGNAVGIDIIATSATANANVPFGIVYRITGLTVGTSAWFEPVFSATIGGTCSLRSTMIDLEEY